MKKYVYLCCLAMMSLSMTAQIDTTDMNWRLVFEDDFSTAGRYWNSSYRDMPLRKWVAHAVGSGVTHGAHEHQVYQRSQCVFDMTDSTMNLVSNYVGGPLIEAQCEMPNGSHFRVEDTTLFFLSGWLDSYDTDNGRDKFQFGYFEIRCKLPVHRGAFPAFWLWGNGTPSDNHYEEIDIFEYSGLVCDKCNIPLGSTNCLTTGIHFNPDEPVYHYQDKYARLYQIIPDLDITDWNVYGCEWSPGKVVWTLNGNVINKYDDATHIPYLPMRLKTNYAIDDYVYDDPNSVTVNTIPLWQGSDIMKIDYIRVYQLTWDCDSDEYITTQDDFDAFDYSVKKNIIITPNSSGVNVVNPTRIHLKATESIEINGEFAMPANSSLILYDCPTQLIQ